MRKNAGGKRRKREPLTTFRTISYTEMSDSRLYPTKEKTLCTNHSVFLVGTNAAARSPAAYVSPDREDRADSQAPRVPRDNRVLPGPPMRALPHTADSTTAPLSSPLSRR